MSRRNEARSAKILTADDILVPAGLQVVTLGTYTVYQMISLSWPTFSPTQALREQMFKTARIQNSGMGTLCLCLNSCSPDRSRYIHSQKEGVARLGRQGG
jgi:hypothetical protein